MSKQRKQQAPSSGRVDDSVSAIFGCDQWLMSEVGFDQVKTALSVVAAGDDSTTLVKKPEPMARGVIHVFGPIAYRDNWISEIFGWSTVSGIQEQLKALEANDDVADVVMLFDTPGGVVTGAPETAELIANFSKPINAFTDSMCASLGYWLASQCNSLHTTKLAMIGSIGAVMEYNKRDKEDAKVFSKNAQHKQGSEESCKALVDEIEDMFVSAAASGRNVSVEDVISKFGQGAMFTGIKSVEVGMADSITTLEDFIANTQVSNSPAPSAISTSSTGANTGMKIDKNKAGGNPAGSNEQAIADAREAGKSDAEASNSEAVDNARTEERERISAISKAGVNKKPEVVQKFIDDGTDAEKAISILELMDDLKPGQLADRMRGTNPDVTGSGGPEDEGDDDDKAAAKAEIGGWDDIYGGDK